MKQIFTRLSFLLMLLTLGFYAQGQIIALDIPDSPDSYLGGGSAFYNGCFDAPVTGELVRAVDDTPTGGDSTPNEGCNPITTDVNGKIAIVDRGNCSFKIKALNAQNAGALAVIICNNLPATDEQGGIFIMADDADIIEDINIVAVMMSLEDCAAFEISLPVMGTLSPADIGPRTIWGDQPGQGNFAGGLNDWTTSTISCNGEPSEYQVWKWREDAIANRGSFGGGADQIASPTACNGAMVFDSDYYDNEGLAQSGDPSDPAFGAGPCPSVQIGELISPVIDLSAADASSISLSFYQNLRQFESQFFVGYSIDGGATWTETELNTDVEGNDAVAEENVFQLIPMTELAGQSDVRIKFRMVGNYYYWVIDDVKIVEGYEDDLEITELFYTPASARQPASQIIYDPFLFAADVTNNGTADQMNVKFYAEVWRLNATADGLEELMHLDSALFEVIPAGVDTTLSIEENYIPTLEPGAYAIIYTVNQEESDQDPEDNSDLYVFEVTESTFAKDLYTSEEQLRALGRLSRNFDDESQPHTYACVYGIGADTKEELFLDNITFSSALREADGVLDGNRVEVYLGEVSEEVDEDYDNFNATSTDFSADGQLDFVGEQEYVFPDGSGLGGILFSTSLNNNSDDAVSDTDPIRLKPGSRYFAMTRYTGASSYVYQMYGTEVDYNFVSTFLFIDGERWYGGYGGGFNPIIRMNMSIVTSIDDTPLPDGAMTVFPNPATDIVQAQFDFEQSLDATVTLATIEGKVIEYRNLPLFKETVSFNTANLAAGMYIMRVATDEGTKTTKFLVQRP